MIGINALALLVAVSSPMGDRMAALQTDHAKYETTVQMISSWSQTATTCDDPNLANIVDVVDSFEEPANYWRTAAYLVSGMRDVAYQYGVWHSDLVLKTADAMVNHCPQIARSFYRYVLETYDRPEYAAVRERAMVGIADVRENASNP